MQTSLYIGLGDRHQQNPSTGSGQAVNYTLDLAAGLTQVLADGTNTYLYGNGRISQHATQTEYFLGDALGSVRQLADSAGAVTLTQSYAPYGEVTQSVGTSQTSYAFTGENLDANGLTYLRVRYLDSGTGRFTQRDPSGLEANLYLYAAANPVNRIDPSGLFSIQDIASSYDLDESQLLTAFSDGSHNSALEGKWGWLKLLLDAKDGQMVHVGVPTIFPPFLDVTSSKQVINDGCNILIGGKNLKNYTKFPLSFSFSPPIWWRKTKPNHYYLDGIEYLDAGRVRDLPDFRTLNGDLISLFGYLDLPWNWVDVAGWFLNAGGSLTIDRYGNVYGSLSAALAPSIGGSPLALGEGYVNHDPTQIIPSIMGQRGIPSETDMTNVLGKGICFGGGVTVTGVSVQGFVCGENISTLSSSTFMYGYDLSLIGDSLGASYTFERLGKVPSLAWDYIERKPGISMEEALGAIK